MRLSNFFFLFSILLAGCTATPPQETPEMPQPTLASPTAGITIPPLSSPTPPIRITPTASPTIVLESPTPIPTETKRPIDNVMICSNNGIPNDQQDILDLPGSLIYQNFSMQELFIAEGNPLSIRSFPISSDDKMAVFGLSPQNWLAYSDDGYMGSHSNLLENPPTIHLLSPTGEHLEHRLDLSVFQPYIRSDLEHGYLQYLMSDNVNGWVNNDLLALTVGIVYTTTSRDYAEYMSAFLNPFSGKWELEIYDQLPDRDMTQRIALSPDLTKALFVNATTHKINLWDMTNKTLLWEQGVDSESIPGSKPIYQWPDDITFAAINPYSSDSNIIFLSSQGKAEKIPTAISPASFDAHISNFQLSPSGQRAALVLIFPDRAQATVRYELFVYDLSSKKYTMRCPLVVNGFAPHFYWSPDENYVATMHPFYQLSNNPEPLLIYNLRNGNVIQLTDDGSAVGWSDK